MTAETWEAFEIYLRSLPRKHNQEETDRLVGEHDAERGQYVNPNLSVHHTLESRH